MSYEIIYGKQFVKLRRTGEVIPMILAGSNNCYDIGVGGRTGRRARSWCSDRFYNRKGKLSEKPEVIIKNLDAELRRIIRNHRGDPEVKPSHIRNHFGYYASLSVSGGHCADTSWNLYRSQYVNGIRTALTIEELDVLGVNLCFGAFEDGPDGKPASVNIKTELEYFIELKKWREWTAKTGRGPYLEFHPYNTDIVLKRLRASRRKPPRERTRIEQDHFFVLTDGHNALVKYTSRGYRYSYHKASGKRFKTKDETEKYRKQLVKKGRYKADIWKVERINSPCSFLV